MSNPSLPGNFGGVIDLGALAKPAITPDNLVGTVISQQTLIGEIIPASHKKVVLVLCWSPRSEQFSVLMDTMAAFHKADTSAEGESAWDIATLNVDAEPQLAKALQVQSVPVVIAIIQEQVVPLFESVPPVDQIRLVIDKVLDIAKERGVGNGPVEGVLPEEIIEPEEEEAMAAMEAGNFEAARDAFKKWVARKPTEQIAKIGLAQTELLIRIKGLDPIHTLQAANANPLDIEAAKKAADIEISQGLNQSAFVRLIGSIKATSGDQRKELRDHLIQLFDLVDPSDPDLIKARGMLASALY